MVYNVYKDFGGDFIKIATSTMISDIDSFASNELGIPITHLMERSGIAVAEAVRRISREGDRVVILCGGGNNGGDGYAAAVKLFGIREVMVYDVFSKGQKSEAGNFWLSEYKKCFGEPIVGLPTEEKIKFGTDIIVDSIFGTGFSGEVPSELSAFSTFINSQKHIKVIAVDIPLGVCADDGTARSFALKCDATVALSFPKLATFSYPAKEYVGEVFVDSLEIDENKVAEKFSFSNFYVDAALAKALLPKRADNASKGSFGKTLLIVGSKQYPGASALALEAALRGGAGYVTFLGNDSLCDFLLNKFPEALYKRVPDFDSETILNYTENQNSILIGSGSGCTEELFCIIKSILASPGSPVILDADAINSIARFGTAEILKTAKREVILTPHPLEFSRLSGISIEEIQNNRYKVAKEFAKEHSCTLLLKGAATVVTDGVTTYINGSGSSALAKAGSGDVLAGLLASILAYSHSPLESAALAAYIHGKAGDELAKEYSSYGVTPSDIPKMTAKIMAEIEFS